MASALRHFLQKGTIRSRLLVAFILLVLLPTSAVTLTTTIIDLSNGKELIKKQLFSVAALKASQVNAWADSLEKDLVIILAVTHLKEISGGPYDENLFENNRPEIELFQQHLNKISQTIRSFEEVFFLSPSGYVLISTDLDSIGQFRGLQPYFSRGIKNPGVHVQTHAFSSDYKGGNKVVVVHPVHNFKEEFIGVLCGLAGMTNLEEIMSETTGLGRTSETYLVGKNRLLLTESRLPEYFPGNVFISSEGINAALDRHERGSGIYRDYRGIPVLGVYLWVPKLEVALLSEMDQLEAYSPIYVMLALNVGMGVSALIIAGILSVFFARGIADPLSELANTATRIADGELYLNVKQDRKDEIGTLAKAFNRMADQMSHRLEAYRLISDMSREFISISSGEIDKAVYRTLKTFGQYYGADRTYVFRISRDTDFFTKTHEWQREGTESLVNPIQELPVNQANPWLMTQLKSMQVVHITNVENLPPEAMAEKVQWHLKGIQSFICIPLIFGESLKGFIGFDFLVENRRIYEEDIRFLRMIGEIICNSLERQHTSEKINASLKEKEVLLKEIHHRVKNNLQVISSLMYLQSKNVRDTALAGIFKDCESRIRSMALVHERLYQSKSMAEIDFGEYVRSLAGYLLQSYGGRYGMIRLETHVYDIYLDVNTAIPCGLIISELVSNALKHAYPGGKQGEIVISFTRDEAGTYTQTVRDNGVGLPENLDFQNTNTLGLRLVNILAKQLNGSLTYSGKGGACFVLIFNEPVLSNFKY
jgi:two-component sensor histidine kinase/HAMP domain-containing protein